MKLIKIKNLEKTYHTKEKEVKSIDSFSLDIEHGEKISIIGPSGCGKSTLLNIISKIDKDYKGKIIEYTPLKIGYMMQSDLLLPWLTVKDNCMLGLHLSKKDNKENENYVFSLLKKYQLYEFKDSYPSNLSGGMRQRVALIRTLAIKPNILLLDEPFSKLDSKTKEQIENDVINIINELKITTILITHDINEAIKLSDRIIVLTSRPSTIKNIHIKNENDIYNTIWSEIEDV